MNLETARKRLRAAVDRASIRVVADRAGVAHSAVQRLLNGAEPRGLTRERLLAYAETLPDPSDTARNGAAPPPSANVERPASYGKGQGVMIGVHEMAQTLAKLTQMALAWMGELPATASDSEAERQARALADVYRIWPGLRPDAPPEDRDRLPPESPEDHQRPG